QIWPAYYPRTGWEAFTFAFTRSNTQVRETERLTLNKTYDRLFVDDPQPGGLIFSLAEGQPGNGGVIRIRGLSSNVKTVQREGLPMDAVAAPAGSQARKQSPAGAAAEMARTDVKNQENSDTLISPPAIAIRKNFNETAFFFPELKTDSSDNVEFSFTMPEAVTRWKWITLAHTKDLAFATGEKSVVTQKQLMVQPNATRFVRQGDRIDFSGKIVNLTDSEMTGQVELQLIDPTTNQSVDGWFQNVFPNQFFTAAPHQSTAVSFSILIPAQYDKALTYRMIARSNNISDGEEGLLPVLSNRTLVTEALQLPVRGTGVKAFTFDKLLKSGESETLTTQSLTVEYT
ncbi:MAG: alpha-2-macroglobulin, partial [Sphingobacteriales bacterium]